MTLYKRRSTFPPFIRLPCVIPKVWDNDLVTVFSGTIACDPLPPSFPRSSLFFPRGHERTQYNSFGPLAQALTPELEGGALADWRPRSLLLGDMYQQHY